MIKSKIELKGIWNPLCVPFKIDNQIDYEAFENNFKKYLKKDIKGFILYGTTGEAPYISLEEKISLLKFTKKLLGSKSNKHIIVGSGLESTYETIKFTNVLADHGVKAALILPPFYFKGGFINDQYYIKHYHTIADQSNIPIIIYNMPKFTGVNLSLDLILELAKHPNIFGLKECDPNIVKLVQIQYAIEKHSISEKFSVLVGSASMIFPSVTLKCSNGGICALANLFPNLISYMYNNILSQNSAFTSYHSSNQNIDMKALHKFILTSKLVSNMGIPGFKTAMDLLGYQGGYPRSPFNPMDKVATLKIKNHLDKFHNFLALESLNIEP